jgi:chromosome segregation ATPase
MILLGLGMLLCLLFRVLTNYTSELRPNPTNKTGLQLPPEPDEYTILNEDAGSDEDVDVDEQQLLEALMDVPRHLRSDGEIDGSNYQQLCKEQVREIECLEERAEKLEERVAFFRYWYPKLHQGYKRKVTRCKVLHADLQKFRQYSDKAYAKYNDLETTYEQLCDEYEEETERHDVEVKKLREVLGKVWEQLRVVEEEVEELKREKTVLERNEKVYKNTIVKMLEEMKGLKSLEEWTEQLTNVST